MVQKLNCTSCHNDVIPLLEEYYQHTKAYCSNCGALIKFLEPSELHSLDEIRAEIWEISFQNVRFIESCKQLTNFYKSKDSLYIRYYNLYLKCAKMVIFHDGQ